MIEMMKEILKKSNIGNIVSSLEEIYGILEKYNIEDDVFIVSLNETMESTINDCYQNYEEEWWNHFDSIELLVEIIVYRTDKINSYDFVEIFHKHTNYSTTEIREYIYIHCNIFGGSVEDYEQYL